MHLVVVGHPTRPLRRSNVDGDRAGKQMLQAGDCAGGLVRVWQGGQVLAGRAQPPHDLLHAGPPLHIVCDAVLRTCEGMFTTLLCQAQPSGFVSEHGARPREVWLLRGRQFRKPTALLATTDMHLAGSHCPGSLTCRSASTSAGHSSGTRTGRQLPRCERSFVTISHRTTP